jgi:hypothetical protein
MIAFSPNAEYMVHVENRKQFTMHKWNGETFSIIWRQSQQEHILYHTPVLTNDGKLVIGAWVTEDLKQVHIRVYGAGSPNPLWNYDFHKSSFYIDFIQSIRVTEGKNDFEIYEIR